MTKRKKKNKYVPLVILLVFVVVMAVAYSMLSASNDKKEAAEAAEEAAANAVTMIAEYDASTMTALTYHRDGEDAIALEVVNGEWKLSADEHFPVDQTVVSQMASAISSIGIKSSIEEGDPSEYGLSEAAYTIEVTYETGESHQYRIGAYNSFGGGSYYFMADGKMYTISSGLNMYFDYGLDDLLLLETMPTDIDGEYINSITVTWDGEEKVFEDEESIDTLFGLFGDIRLTECADYYMEDTEREVYGLDGTRSLTISYKRAVTTSDADGNETTSRLDTSYTFLIGADAGHDEAYYGSPDKSSIAYLIPSSTIEALIAVS